MQKIKCKVVMLATDSPIKIGNIIKRENSKIPIQIVNNPFDADGRLSKLEWKVQHLYLISDEEIKSTDIVYCTVSNQVISSCPSIDGEYPKWWKKVVATTNTELNLPLIPQNFIEEYVELNGSINEVEIELELIESDKFWFDKFPDSIHPKTYQVIISKSKETWTRDEVVQLLIDVAAETADYIEFNNPECAITPINTLRKRFLDNWIQDNLK